ncbi:MAG TPA: PQQ-binding-like beta-propeller repeat protein, partial [Vicinamibacteria bacterium]|nr:PQQ-binding-like beta-propeller repeat protein [Vicinamibacteria bacterium]
VNADWPQWRGPHRDGKSTDTGLLHEWPEGGPPLLWQAEGLGRGFSSVSEASGRLFTMGDFGDTQFVLALSDDDGSILWKTAVGPSWADSDLYPGSRSTPTTDGDRVYALGTEGTLLCLRAATGEVLWRRNLIEDFGGFVMMARAGVNWRYTESPLVDGDRVVATPGAPDAALVALNKLTGDEIWRAAIPELGGNGDDGAGYSSMVVSHAAGVKQYVQLMGRGLVGIRAEDGAFLWGYNRIANDVANIATPIVSGDHVFGSTGYGTGAALLELTASGEGVSAREVYFLEASTFQNHHGGIVLHEGHLYTGTGHNNGLPLSTRFETGEVAWGPIRNDGRNSAAIAYADGHLYFRYQDGLVVLIEASPAAYQECGSFRIPNVDEPSWPHPVVTGGRLYLREQDRLYSYDVRGSHD